MVWITPNKHGVRSGDRLVITQHVLTNGCIDSNFPLGLTGTVVYVNEGTHSLYIHMDWDDGSKLALLEKDSDCYKKI
jgi:hypothetical protein